MDGKNIKYRIGKSYVAQIVTTVFAFACVIPLLFILGLSSKQASPRSTGISWSMHPQTRRRNRRRYRQCARRQHPDHLLRLAHRVPIGILAGIYLSENGKSRLAYWCRLCVDILQGVPSIVIGIIAYFWLVKPLGGFSALVRQRRPGHYDAAHHHPVDGRDPEITAIFPAGSSLRAGHAFSPGHLQGRRPVGISGILSGVMLSIARITGETAPLLFTAFGNPYLSFNITKPMQSLPHLIFDYATSPYDDWKNLAWGASVILLAMGSYCLISSPS
jgi:phosphate transport system permease protein